MNNLRVGLLSGCRFDYQIDLALTHNINILDDPILCSIAHTQQAISLQSMKKKARILIPESCNLIGVVDESGILEADEIFVQIRPDNFSSNRS